MARKEGMVVMDVEVEAGSISVDLNLDDDEVAVGGVTSSGTRLLMKVTDDGTGKGILNVVAPPGAVIATSPDTAVGGGATVPLPAPPAGTRRMRVQVTSGDGTTRIRVREVGGPAGSGVLLILLGSTLYGDGGGSIAPLEVENVLGPASAVSVQFES